jgi:hypothetical protein
MSNEELIRLLRDGALLISNSRTQNEALESLLAASSSLTPSCGLLIVRGSQASGWSCIGLTTPENFKGATLDCTRGAVAAVLSSCAGCVAKISELDPAFAKRLGLELETEVLLLPLVLKERVAGLLLAKSCKHDELAALEVLVQVAQQALELPGRRAATPAAAEVSPPAEVQHSTMHQAEAGAAAGNGGAAEGKSSGAAQAVPETAQPCPAASPVAQSAAGLMPAEVAASTPSITESPAAPMAKPQSPDPKPQRAALALSLRFGWAAVGVMLLAGWLYLAWANSPKRAPAPPSSAAAMPNKAPAAGASSPVSNGMSGAAASKPSPLAASLPQPGTAAAPRRPANAEVLVRVTVDAAGHAQAFKVVRGDPRMSSVAISTAKAWNFQPCIGSGSCEHVLRVIDYGNASLLRTVAFRRRRPEFFVRIMIDAAGHAQSLEAMGGDPRKKLVALNAARAWSFQPCLGSDSCEHVLKVVDYGDASLTRMIE